jgi:hypothetical protein
MAGIFDNTQNTFELITATERFKKAAREHTMIYAQNRHNRVDPLLTEQGWTTNQALD